MTTRVLMCLWVSIAAVVLAAVDVLPVRAASAQAAASDMVLVPAGEFLMGADDGLESEKPQRRVFVDAFHIDRHEVTNGQYRLFLEWVKKNTDASVKHADQPKGKDHTPRYWKSFRPQLLTKTGMAKLQHFDEETFRKDDHPVVGIEWFDAYAYAKWAGKRLPTEAEWEKAARGTDGRMWPWGNEWDFKKCNSGGYEWKGERDGHIYAAAANSYFDGVSPYGCLNMAGNVWEWTADWYAEDPGSQPMAMKNPPGPSKGDKRVIKGGGSNSYPSWVRPAARKAYEPEFRFFCLGFRCAKNVSTRK